MKQHKAKLLYTEKFADKHDAAKREREIKGWRREKNWHERKEGIPAVLCGMLIFAIVKAFLLPW